MNLAPFQAVYPNLDMVTSPDSFFGTVKSQFLEYADSGFFKKDEEKAIFVYKLTTEERTYKAIIACASIEDFIQKNVLVHENTLAAKEQNMMNIMLHNKAMVKPILLAYHPVKEIDTFIDDVIKNESPFFSVPFENEHSEHLIYRVTDSEKIKLVQTAFKKKVVKTYIADGHHRAKTSILLNKTNKLNDKIDSRVKNVLSVLFAWDELDIYDYNRSVDVFQLLSPLKFMALLSKYVTIKPLKTGRKPKKKHEMTMFLYNEWYRLKWKKSVLKKHANDLVIFDATLLNEYILHDIVGMENIREDVRIRYIDGVSGIENLENIVLKNENRVGFCLYPIEAKEIQKVAENHQTLPPKSTWFEPRVKNGLLVKEF